MSSATPHVQKESFDEAVPVMALRKIKEKVNLQMGKYKKSVPQPDIQRPATMNDFSRLARRLCGKSIGIVLGGGGARGISHMGVLRALEEHGVPIDMVGGTSIGAFVGGLYAREGDLVSTYGRLKRFSGRMSTLWRILTDLTYPVVAYTTGESFRATSLDDLGRTDLGRGGFQGMNSIAESTSRFTTFKLRTCRGGMLLPSEKS